MRRASPIAHVLRAAHCHCASIRSATAQQAWPLQRHNQRRRPARNPHWRGVSGQPRRGPNMPSDAKEHRHDILQPAPVERRIHRRETLDPIGKRKAPARKARVRMLQDREEIDQDVTSSISAREETTRRSRIKTENGRDNHPSALLVRPEALRRRNAPANADCRPDSQARSHRRWPAAAVAASAPRQTHHHRMIGLEHQHGPVEQALIARQRDRHLGPALLVARKRWRETSAAGPSTDRLRLDVPADEFARRAPDRAGSRARADPQHRSLRLDWKCRAASSMAKRHGLTPPRLSDERPFSTECPRSDTPRSRLSAA